MKAPLNIQMPNMAEPDAALIELVNYLAEVNPTTWSDTTGFWRHDGSPDPLAALAFADLLRARVRGANTERLLQIEQVGHQVTVAFAPAMVAAMPAAVATVR